MKAGRWIRNLPGTSWKYYFQDSYMVAENKIDQQ